MAKKPLLSKQFEELERKLKQDLAQKESDLFLAEQKYLKESAQHPSVGNVFTGFDA